MPLYKILYLGEENYENYLCSRQNEETHTFERNVNNVGEINFKKSIC